MIRYFLREKPIQGFLTSLPDDLPLEEVAWVDLFAPAPEEREIICQQFNLAPFSTIEQRLTKQPNWQDAENGLIVFRVPFSAPPASRMNGTSMTFILSKAVLITTHNLDTDLVGGWIAEEHYGKESCDQPEDFLIELLEQILIHHSEKAEAVNLSISDLSRKVFTEPKNQSRAWRKSMNLRGALREIGRIGSVCIALNDNLHRLERIPFFLQSQANLRLNSARQARLEGIREDAATLIESVVFIQQQNTLVLDATLGIITLEENSVMRWLTIIATIFIPPTLVASVYGMNFSELSSLGGEAAFPIALALMIFSAFIPILFFIRRGWL